mmetsp:Transcript_5207/g.8967  ORF Transcript_5207/g.8967 Transcript_5207/m.8967 type:complete len:135 (-) Transcript_5207:607-1011(-)
MDQGDDSYSFEGGRTIAKMLRQGRTTKRKNKGTGHERRGETKPKAHRGLNCDKRQTRGLNTQLTLRPCLPSTETLQRRQRHAFRMQPGSPKHAWPCSIATTQLSHVLHLEQRFSTHFGMLFREKLLFKMGHEFR